MLAKAASLSLSIILAAGFWLTITLKQSYAYIDAGSGAFFLQILLASAFGGLFMLKVFWRKVVDQISRLPLVGRKSKTHSE